MNALVGQPSPLLALPPRGAALLALLAIYLVCGLLGHDPWRSEDAVGFGVVHGLLAGGPWLTPQLAGEPYTNGGPLFFWLSAITASITSWLLPAHDGARLASLLSVGLALYFTRLAARELYGKEAGDLSCLALAGCLGFLIHARETAPETAMLAGIAAAHYGIAIAWKKPRKGGVFFGIGLAVAFLALGLRAIVPPLAAALLLMPLATADRARGYKRAVLAGALTLAAIAGGWLLLAQRADPVYASAWLEAQLAFVTASPRLDVWTRTVEILAWSAWPAWPLAVWAAWAYRRTLRNPGYAVPFVGIAVALVQLAFAVEAREMDTLALLVPLAVPAGAVAMNLRRGAANALAWFGLMTAAVLAVALWVLWIAMMTGAPAKLAANVGKLAPGFEPTLSVGLLAAAAVVTGLWIWFVAKSELNTMRALPMWIAGLTLVWGLAMTLWLPWIDYTKTYRRMGDALRAELVGSTGCIASLDLGQVQRAVLHYHAGLVTQRLETGRGGACAYLLVQARAQVEEAAPPAGWVKIWEGARARDNERFRLYQRRD
jgi:4-amino-4-deoxy-L-arabinose transferase-like glycosyltransferase